MTNFEKYSGTLKTTNFGLINEVPVECDKILNSFENDACTRCRFYTSSDENRIKNCGELRMYWLLQEYVEPKINIPADIPIDTKILVSTDGITWHRRYYAGKRNGEHVAWVEGKTSWSSEPDKCKAPWEYMKLYE